MNKPSAHCSLVLSGLMPGCSCWSPALGNRPVQWSEGPALARERAAKRAALAAAEVMKMSQQGTVRNAFKGNGQSSAIAVVELVADLWLLTSDALLLSILKEHLMSP